MLTKHTNYDIISSIIFYLIVNTNNLVGGNNLFNQITIDGGAATGKSTVARKVAEKLGYYHINSGYIFRCIAASEMLGNYLAQGNEVTENWINGLELTFSNKEIYVNGRNFFYGKVNSMEVSSKTAQIARFNSIREKVDGFALKISESTNIVIDGRSSGVFLFPNSKNKFFLTCNVYIRARRRLIELGMSDNELEEVVRRLQERDFEDSNRKVQPMQIAKDATCVDTSRMTIDEVVNTIIEHVK